jgi:LAO/AO transport system kinase
MQRHALDEGVFIRSMGSRGQAGGLSRSTYDACLVLDAMGYDVVIVETVGVGQDEIDIVSLAHTTVIVAVPGLGDEVQAVKAGLLEVGEIFVINKADREGAEQTRRQLELMLQLRAKSGTRSDGWEPPLLMAVASKNEGGEAIADALERHAERLRAVDGFARQFGLRSHHQFLALLREAATARLLDQALRNDVTAAVVEDLRTRRIDPYTAADALIARVGLATDPSA